MFRLLRLLIGLVVLAAAGIFAITVPLGERTLWGHLKAIAGSKESQQLVEGVKQKAGKVLHTADGGGDQLSAEERKALRKLIRERLAGEGDAGAKANGRTHGGR